MKQSYALYDTWLQRGYTLSESMKTVLSQAVLLSEDQQLEFCMKEYIRGVRRMFGTEVQQVPKEQAGVLLGTLEQAAKCLPQDGKTPGAEGFRIYENGGHIAVVGADRSGLLYGIYRLLMLLARGKLPKNADICETPAVQVRALNHWDNMSGQIERGYAGESIFFKDEDFCFEEQRVVDYARMLASVGINTLTINNVNVHQTETFLISERFLPKLARIADLFRPFGIRLLVSINFASPMRIGGLATSDPLDEGVQHWWERQTELIYRWIPDLCGFLVKADSEHEPGPYQYGRNHADGANMLARALKPYGGIVMWRCFVYDCAQDWRNQKIDRPRAAYDNFVPLDGQFADNVILQVKNGPYDFQVREPVTPLFGAMKQTHLALEVQVTQEYTGQQRDLCSLLPLWQDVLRFDTKRPGTVADMFGGQITAMAGVANIGKSECWTGHPLAQVNLYGFGRLSWNPALTPEEITDEYVKLAFGSNPEVTGKIADILQRSYPAYEDYTSPLGLCWMVNPGYHYGPNVEGYEYTRWGTYLRATCREVGIDRTAAGTGYTTQYAPENDTLFSNTDTCPEKLLLFFHRLPYSYKLHDGRTILQYIYDTRFHGEEEAEAMAAEWDTLKDKIAPSLYEAVAERFGMQLENAREWRDVVNTYFYRHTGIADEKGRKIYK